MLFTKVTRRAIEVLNRIQGVNCKRARRGGHKLTQPKSTFRTHRPGAVTRLMPDKCAQELGLEPIARSTLPGQPPQLRRYCAAR